MSRLGVDLETGESWGVLIDQCILILLMLIAIFVDYLILSTKISYSNSNFEAQEL